MSVNIKCSHIFDYHFYDFTHNVVHLVDLTFTELLKLSLTIRVSGRVITDKAIANTVSGRIIHRVIDLPDSAHIFMVTPLLIHIGEILVLIL